MNWIECVVDNDYEIQTEYPYQIRRKADKKIVNEYKCNTGFTYCYFNKKEYCKHRIIALQFIPNPDNLRVVNHINHDKTDNHIQNLQWAKHHN